MDASNMDDIRGRLAKQGISGDVELYGGYDDTGKGRKAGQAPPRPRDKHGNPQLHEKNAAASKVAAAYRGRQGRKKAAHEQRKLDRYTREAEEEYYEATR